MQPSGHQWRLLLLRSLHWETCEGRAPLLAYAAVADYRYAGCSKDGYRSMLAAQTDRHWLGQQNNSQIKFIIVSSFLSPPPTSSLSLLSPLFRLPSPHLSFIHPHFPAHSQLSPLHSSYDHYPTRNDCFLTQLLILQELGSGHWHMSSWWWWMLWRHL